MERFYFFLQIMVPRMAPRRQKMQQSLSPPQITSALIKNITAELDSHNWSLMRLSEESGVPYDTLKKLLSGRIHNPHLCNIAKIAYALNVDMNTLSGLTEHSMEVLGSQHTSNLIKYLVEFEKSLAVTKKYESKKFIPVFLPLSTAQNTGHYCDSIGGQMLSVDAYKDSIGDRAEYGIKIRTNTYNPVYCQNDILLIGKDRAPVSGETGIFINERKIYIRRFLDGSPIILEPVNSIGSAITLKSLRKWTIAGYVLGVYR